MPPTTGHQQARSKWAKALAGTLPHISVVLRSGPGRWIRSLTGSLLRVAVVLQPKLGYRLGLVAKSFLLVVALFLVFVAYGSVDNRWYRVLAIAGGSMEPTIHFGDAIVITRPPRRLAPGMIVTMQVGRAVVTHRIVEMQPGGIVVTKGDANPVPDIWDPHKARVVGVYFCRIPYLGSAVLSTKGFLLAVKSRLANLSMGGWKCDAASNPRGSRSP